MDKSAALKIGVVALLIGLYAASRVVSERDATPPSGTDTTAQTSAPSGAPVVPNATRLQSTDIKVGSGATAQTGKTVSVHYRGTRTDGTEFDQSYKRGEPFEFKLGAGDVIKGWDQGVVGMQVGGKRRLVIPPDLGYGSRGAGNDIPPNATLIFEIELLKVS
jgi:FKBP-type peptidyl-prolyl cis-trans isomerase